MTQDQIKNIAKLSEDLSEHLPAISGAAGTFSKYLSNENEFDPFNGDADSDSDSEFGPDSPLDHSAITPLFSNKESQIPSHLPPKLSSLHKCLLALYTHDIYEDVSAFHFLPSYVIFSSKRPDGKFKSARKQTPAIAALKYIGKVTFLHQLFLQAQFKGKEYPSNGYEVSSSHSVMI